MADSCNRLFKCPSLAITLEFSWRRSVLIRKRGPRLAFRIQILSGSKRFGYAFVSRSLGLASGDRLEAVSGVPRGSKRHVSCPHFPANSRPSFPTTTPVHSTGALGVCVKSPTPRRSASARRCPRQRQNASSLRAPSATRENLSRGDIYRYIPGEGLVAGIARRRYERERRGEEEEEEMRKRREGRMRNRT